MHKVSQIVKQKTAPPSRSVGKISDGNWTKLDALQDRKVLLASRIYCRPYSTFPLWLPHCWPVRTHFSGIVILLPAICCQASFAKFHYTRLLISLTPRAAQIVNGTAEKGAEIRMIALKSKAFFSTILIAKTFPLEIFNLSESTLRCLYLAHVFAPSQMCCWNNNFDCQVLLQLVI